MKQSKKSTAPSVFSWPVIASIAIFLSIASKGHVDADAIADVAKNDPSILKANVMKVAKPHDELPPPEENAKEISFLPEEENSEFDAVFVDYSEVIGKHHEDHREQDKHDDDHYHTHHDRGSKKHHHGHESSSDSSDSSRWKLRDGKWGKWDKWNNGEKWKYHDGKWKYHDGRKWKHHNGKWDDSGKNGRGKQWDHYRKYSDWCNRRHSYDDVILLTEQTQTKSANPSSSKFHTIPQVILNTPSPFDKAATARWLAHNTDWGVLSTITATSRERSGTPFGNIVSHSDGPPNASTGTLYFLVSPLDTSMKDIAENDSVNFVLSEMQTTYCATNKYDAEDPRCARLSMSGRFLQVNKSSSSEYDIAKNAMLSRHPVMKSWIDIDSHNFQFYKLELEQIWLIDYFGGAKIVDKDAWDRGTDKDDQVVLPETISVLLEGDEEVMETSHQSYRNNVMFTVHVFLTALACGFVFGRRDAFRQVEKRQEEEQKQQQQLLKMKEVSMS